MPKLYEYIVEGRGAFPLDMLRYDSAWPANGDAVAAMEWDAPAKRSREVYTVALRSYSTPTIDRWRSFGWSVRSPIRTL